MEPQTVRAFQLALYFFRLMTEMADALEKVGVLLDSYSVALGTEETEDPFPLITYQYPFRDTAKSRMSRMLTVAMREVLRMSTGAPEFGTMETITTYQLYRLLEFLTKSIQYVVRRYGYDEETPEYKNRVLVLYLIFGFALAIAFYGLGSLGGGEKSNREKLSSDEEISAMIDEIVQKAPSASFLKHGLDTLPKIAPMFLKLN